MHQYVQNFVHDLSDNITIKAWTDKPCLGSSGQVFLSYLHDIFRH